MFSNKVAYLIFLILTGMFAVFYNSYFTGIFFLTIIIMPVILYIFLSITTSRISVELLPCNNIIKKSETEGISLRFTNQSVFPVNRILISIQYVNDVTGIKKLKIVELALDQQSTQIIRIDLQSSHCGNIRISIEKILIFDFLHIWKKRKKLNLKTMITVVPDICKCDLDFLNKIYTNDASADSEKYSKEKKGEDASEVFEIRNYRRGDKPNRIHWKLSQKVDQVMIKEFSDPLKDSVVFVLNPFCKENGEIRLERMDGFLESIITLSNSFLLAGKYHSVIWFDPFLDQYQNIQLSKAEDKYIAVARFLKTPVLTEYKTIMEDFDQISNTEYKGIFYVTTKIIKEDLEYLHYHSKLTFCVLIFVNDLDQNELSQEMKQTLYKYQITYYEIHIKNVEESFLKILEANLMWQSKQ